MAPVRPLLRWLPAALVAALVLGTSGASWARGRGPDIRRPPARRSVAAARNVTVVPLTVHVAVPVGADRIVAWVRRANEALRPHGLEVTVARVVHERRGPTRLRRPRDRRRLARKAAHDGTVHVFVVEAIDPVRRLGLRRLRKRRVRGLYWRFHRPGRGTREFVVVTTGAPSTTLVHEIGHAFGLPHRPGQANLMCSCRHGGVQVFTRGQGRLLRDGARRFLQRAAR